MALFKSRLGAVLAAAAVIAICAAIRYNWGSDSARADTPRPPASANTASAAPGKASTAAAAAKPMPAPAVPRKADANLPTDSSRGKIVAMVNDEPITREQLGEECLRHYGDIDLRLLVDRYLIADECKRQNITITRAEVDAEVDRLAKRFKFTVDQWWSLLKEKRGVAPAQYTSDVIWPMFGAQEAGRRAVDHYARGATPGVREPIRCGGPRG